MLSGARKFRLKPSIAQVLIGLAVILGICQFFFIIWTADKTYLEVQSVRQEDETRRLAVIIAQGMSDRVRNVEHMTRRVIAAVPRYLKGSEISSELLDSAVEDMGGYAQSNEVGLGIFSKIADSDFILSDYRGSPDFRSLFTVQTGSVMQLIATAAKSNHSESTVAQSMVLLPNPETGEDQKIKMLFAVTATPLVRSFDLGEEGEPGRQVFFVSMAVLHPINPGRGLPPECVLNNCEGQLRAETGARWTFISQKEATVGKRVSASAPVWPLPFDVIITTYVSPLSDSIPGFQSKVTIIAVVACIFGILILTLAVQFLVRRPINRVRAGLGAIADNVSARLPGSFLREFSDVYRGFNRMAGRLEMVQTDLKSTAARWKSLIYDNMSIMLMIDAATGVIVFANKAAMDFYGFEENASTLGMLNALAADEDSTIDVTMPSFEKRIQQHTSQGIKTVDITGGIAEIEGRATMLAIVSDATELVAAQHEATMAARARFETLESHLESLNELVSRERRVRSSIAHEIRNPLASISWAIENISSESGLSEGVVKRVENIKRTLARVEELVSKGLSSKGDNVSGLLGEAQMKPQDICEFVRKIARNWRDSEMRHQYRIEIGSEDMLVNFDAFLMQSVIDNLILNAIKYSEPGTKIWVRVEKLDQRVEICVADEGIGIPESFLPYVGERMKRAENALHLPGSGQGIHLCKSIVALHEGEFLVESKENVGTTIRIRMPIHVERAEMDSADAA